MVIYFIYHCFIQSDIVEQIWIHLFKFADNSIQFNSMSINVKKNKTYIQWAGWWQWWWWCWGEFRRRRFPWLESGCILCWAGGLRCPLWMIVIHPVLQTVIQGENIDINTLLKSDVTTRDHVIRCRGSQECGSRNVNFACKFHRRSHRVRITLKSTTFLFMRSKNVWTTKPWFKRS